MIVIKTEANWQFMATTEANETMANIEVRATKAF